MATTTAASSGGGSSGMYEPFVEDIPSWDILLEKYRSFLVRCLDDHYEWIVLPLDLAQRAPNFEELNEYYTHLKLIDKIQIMFIAHTLNRQYKDLERKSPLQ